MDLAEFSPVASRAFGRSGGYERMGARPLIERLGRKVDADRPRDGACFAVNGQPRRSTPGH